MYALRELCAWVLQITSCFIIGEIKFGRCYAICQTTKLKSLPNFPTINYGMLHASFSREGTGLVHMEA